MSLNRRGTAASSKAAEDSSCTLRGQDIAILASAPWAGNSRANCHHIAQRLAKHNRVLFIESPGLRTPNLLHAADVHKVWRRLCGWMRNLFSGPRQVAPNLYVLSPILFPLRSNGVIEQINGAVLACACARAIRRLDFRNTILWAFLPTAVHLLGRLDEHAVLYHCVGYYAGNPGVDSERLKAEEQRLVAAADLCLATSKPLADRLARVGGKTVCVPNVAEVERFALAPDSLPSDLDAIPRPIIGYVGNIAYYKVDLDLMAEIATRRPGWSIVLAGPTGIGDPSTRTSALQSLKNVHFIGPKPYEKVASYVHGFDVCLIPFSRNRVTDCSLPLKTFEYLAAGKPVVCTRSPALTAEQLDDVLRYADGADEFVDAISAALFEQHAQSVAERRQVAADYSWEKRFPEIEHMVRGCLAEKEVDSPQKR